MQVAERDLEVISMKFELRNPKGTRDYLPEEQYTRNQIKRILVDIFEKHGYLPLETPILNYYEVLASKYGGGAEILQEVYRLTDQGDRNLALRYDLTVPFAKTVGMNADLRLPFKRYEVGKVFRDGPVKAGRNREFTQCDVDIVGVKSVIAEAELMAMALAAFESLGLNVYISYNNRKLLSGIITQSEIKEQDINQVILSLDKIEKIGAKGVYQELLTFGIADVTIDRLLSTLELAMDNPLEYFKNISGNAFLSAGIKELEQLNCYLTGLNLMGKVKLNPCLARGLDIYTGTVYEVFLTNGSITSSLAAGGRYDNIIGGFLNNGSIYPAAGISFGLDVIQAALALSATEQYRSPIDLLIIPIGTELESLQLAQELRGNGCAVAVEMTGRKLKKALNYADKMKIPYTVILGEEELKLQSVKLKDMFNSTEQVISINALKKLDLKA